MQLFLACKDLCALLFSYNTWERFSTHDSLHSWFVVLFKHLPFCFALHFKTTSYLGRSLCLPGYYTGHCLKCHSWITQLYRSSGCHQAYLHGYKTIWNCILWIILRARAEKNPHLSQANIFGIVFILRTLLFAWRQYFFLHKTPSLYTLMKICF